MAAKIDVSLGGKVCPGCKHWKDWAGYTSNKAGPTAKRQRNSSGYSSTCRSCQADVRRRRARMLRPQKVTGPKPLPLIRRRYRDMLKQTPEAFEAFFNEFSHEDHRLPAHAKVWVAAALANPLLLLNCPPRHAKTTIMVEWFVIWQLACNRNTQIIIVSQTVSVAQKSARKIADELESNQNLVMAYGRFRPADPNRPWRTAAGEFEVEGKDLSLRSGDLSVQIRGAQQQILGMEADWVIADDITDRKVASSQAQREDEREWFVGEVLTRLSPDGKAFCIGQRVHSEDIYGYLANEVDDNGSSVWHLQRTPAVLDYEEKLVLWPEVWPWAKLMKRRSAVGSAVFNCMFQQQPEISGEFIPKWWITGTADADTPGCLDHDRVIGTGWKNATQQFVPVTRVLSVDPSPTRYAAIIVGDVVYQQRATNFYCSIVDIRRSKDWGLRGMLANIEEMARELHPSICIWETNSAKQLREDPAWNQISALFTKVQPHNTTINKRDVELGVWSLAADFEAGRIRLPYGSKESREVSDLLIDEALAYPNGYTDDVLMALWFVKFNYRRLLPVEFLPSSFNQFGFRPEATWNVPGANWAGSERWGQRVPA